MFSVVSVCLFNGGGGGLHVTAANLFKLGTCSIEDRQHSQPLTHTGIPGAQPSLRHVQTCSLGTLTRTRYPYGDSFGPASPPPTCSNLFTWGRLHSPTTGHINTWGSGWLAFDWKAFFSQKSASQWTWREHRLGEVISLRQESAI